MDIFQQYATNETTEVEGSWQDVGDARFLVARSGNRKYIKKLIKLAERNKKTLDRKDDEADKLSDSIMIDVLAETILLGWEGVSFKGAPMLYSVENAKILLAVKDFRKIIGELSDDFESYKADKEEAEVKN